MSVDGRDALPQVPSPIPVHRSLLASPIQSSIHLSPRNLLRLGSSSQNPSPSVLHHLGLAFSGSEGVVRSFLHVEFILISGIAGVCHTLGDPQPQSLNQPSDRRGRLPVQSTIISDNPGQICNLDARPQFCLEARNPTIHSNLSRHIQHLVAIRPKLQPS